MNSSETMKQMLLVTW